MKKLRYKGLVRPDRLERDDYLKYLVDKDGRIYYDAVSYTHLTLPTIYSV